MKNYILLFSSLLLFNSAGTVFAQNEDRIEEIKTEIEQKKSEIESLEKELSSLLPEDDSNEFEIQLNNPIEFDDFEITIIDYSLSKDFNDDDVLVINYHFVNTSDETLQPYLSFNIKAFQNSVETDRRNIVENVDLSLGQKDIKPEGEIDAQTYVGISELNTPLELELTDMFNRDVVYSVELDLNDLPK